MRTNGRGRTRKPTIVTRRPHATSIAERGHYRPDFEDGFAVQQAVAAIQESDERDEWVFTLSPTTV